MEDRQFHTEDVLRFVYKTYKLPYNGSEKAEGEMFMGNCIFSGCFVVSILLLLFSGYAYLVNNRLAPDDPARKDYDPGAVFLAPITWPFFAFGVIVITILKAVVFGVFLLVFSLAVAVIRKPFFWPWIEPFVSRIGRSLLKANTFLIRLFYRDS